MNLLLVSGRVSTLTFDGGFKWVAKGNRLHTVPLLVQSGPLPIVNGVITPIRRVVIASYPSIRPFLGLIL